MEKITTLTNKINTLTTYVLMVIIIWIRTCSKQYLGYKLADGKDKTIPFINEIYAAHKTKNYLFEYISR